MPAFVADSALAVRYLRKLHGGSQSMLVQADDGFYYVVKFANNLQGRNVLFNEAIGNELYRACGLPIPGWKPIRVTDQFIDNTRECWTETSQGRLRPAPGFCFGSRHLGNGGKRLVEILTSSTVRQILNTADFWLAWLLDICAWHTDNRQAIFVEQRGRGLEAVFVDYGHMFSGPDGISDRWHFKIPVYCDPRVYKQISMQYRVILAQIVINLNKERLWRTASQLPIDWQTETGLRNLSICLNMLGNSKTVRSIIELIAGSPQEKYHNEDFERQDERKEPNWILRAGIQAAG